VNYLGVDFGTKRVGLSIYSDDVKIILPLPAILAEDDDKKLEEILHIVKLEKISVIVVGYPINMDGTIGDKAKAVEIFIEKLGRKLSDNIKIFKVDERLTSEEAIGYDNKFYGRQSPTKKVKRRKSGVVDSQSAMIILRDFLIENGIAEYSECGF
jgi:putative Holliday junction resolvase